MRVRQIRVDKHFVELLLKEGVEAAVPVEPAPADLRIVHARLERCDPYAIEGLFVLLVESQTFDEVAINEEAPLWNVLFRRTEVGT